jgi:hypothetical protein
LAFGTQKSPPLLSTQISMAGSQQTSPHFVLPGPTLEQSLLVQMAWPQVVSQVSVGRQQVLSPLPAAQNCV